MKHMKVYAVDLSDPSIFPPAAVISDPGSFIGIILRFVYLIAGIIAFGLFIGGGFMMIGGANNSDSAQMAKGKQAITYAIIGLVIIFGSYFFIQFIERIFGVKILKL